MMQQERDDFAVTDEHATESSQQPTRETATGGASGVVLEYGWASPLTVPGIIFGGVAVLLYLGFHTY
jgi:hypothetical protein